MARRSTQPRELVRLTPLQFSLSVSIVVLLIAGAGLAGYVHGQKEARKDLQAAKPVPSLEQGMVAPSSEPVADSQAPVTFYSVLTEERETPASTEPASPESPPAPGPVSTPAPEPSATSSPAAKATSTSIMLQVASYAKEEAAARLLGDLSEEGYRGTVIKADLGERGIWYRVRVGPYGGEKDARRALEKLREERSLKGFVVK